MKKTPLLLVLAVSGAGLLSGLTARRMMQGAAAVASDQAVLETTSLTVL